MLPPDLSPLHAVVLPLWETRGHQSHIRQTLRSRRNLEEIALLRRRLWQGALQEMEANFAACRTYYDPRRDARFEWACQFLDVLDGTRDSVDTYKSQLGLYQSVDGPVTLEGNPAFLGELVAALGSVRFFQSPGQPAPAPSGLN